MNPKLPLMFEISSDTSIFTVISTVSIPVPNLIFSKMGPCYGRIVVYMNFCNHRIHFKISLGLLLVSILCRKIYFGCVLALEMVEIIFYIFQLALCPGGGLDLYGDGEVGIGEYISESTHK